MNNVISNIFEEMFQTPATMRKSAAVPKFRPRTNIFKTDDAYILEANVAGIAKENIKIDIEDTNLKISYTAPETNESLNTIRREFSMQSFERNFTIGDTIDIEGITAQFDNGILRLNLPLKQETKPVVKSIEII